MSASAVSMETDCECRSLPSARATSMRRRARNRQVDSMPDGRQAPHEERRDLDRGKHPQRDHAPRHCDRPPRRSKRDQNIGRTEMHIGITDDGADVNRRECDGGAAEKPVQVGEPARSGRSTEHPVAKQEPPQHRHREHYPCHHAARPREIPPGVRHAATASSCGSISIVPSSVTVATSASRCQPPDRSRPPMSTAFVETSAHHASPVTAAAVA